MRTNPAVLDAYLGGEDDSSTQHELAEEADTPTVADHGHAGANRERAKLGDSPALLTCGDVTAGYGGGDILKNVSLDVPRGGITCVVGPNGAGKSTLMATISGLLRPRQGEISSAASGWRGSTPQADPRPWHRPRSRRLTACSET